MKYPRWHELNVAYLTTFTAHTTDLVAIREQGSSGLWNFIVVGSSRTWGGHRPRQKPVVNQRSGCFKIGYRVATSGKMQPEAALNLPGQETHVDSERSMDQGAGAEARNDRAVQRKAGGGRRYFIRSFVLWLRPESLERIQNFYKCE